jgi:hypothetical protein
MATNTNALRQKAGLATPVSMAENLDPVLESSGTATAAAALDAKREVAAPKSKTSAKPAETPKSIRK